MADRPAGRHRTAPRRPLRKRLAGRWDWLLTRWWTWGACVVLYGWMAYRMAAEGFPPLSALFSTIGSMAAFAAGYLIQDR